MQYSSVDVYEGDMPFLTTSFIWVVPVYVVLVTSNEFLQRAKDAMIVGVVFSEVADVRPLAKGGSRIRFAKIKRTDRVWCGVHDCNKKLSLMSPARD
jgi:hypothetical protein